MVNGEPFFAAMFAGMLIAGTLLVLLFPVFTRLTEERSTWRLYALLALVIGVMGLSLYVVFIALEEPLYFLPFVVLVLALRGASPTFLYRSLRDRFDMRGWWPVVRIVLAGGFVALAGYLLYTLLLSLIGPIFGVGRPGVDYTELALMAVGGAFTIVRLLARILPESWRDKPNVWVAALLISISFAVLAPFAFPGYEPLYRAAGVGGWLLGFVVLWKFD